MITISETITSILTLQRINYFFLVSIKDRHYTTCNFDITMDNGITYLSDIGLLTVDAPRTSSTVDRSSYKVYIADSSFELRSYFETGAVGDEIQVRLGFYNTLDDVTDGVPVGEPFKQIANTIIVYEGVIDTQSYDIDLRNNEITATIEGSSPMAALDLVRIFYTNKDSLKQRDPTDTSFDKVAEGSGEIKLKWGKV